jgi:hypothetical protein
MGICRNLDSTPPVKIYSISCWQQWDFVQDLQELRNEISSGEIKQLCVSTKLLWMIRDRLSNNPGENYEAIFENLTSWEQMKNFICLIQSSFIKNPEKYPGI